MDQTFVLCQEGFHPESAAREESLFSLGNGFLGWRGNYEEGYGQFRGGVEGCYLNGFYETEKIRYGEIAYGYAEESQTMLNITSSQRVLLEAEGTALHPDGAESTCRVGRAAPGDGVRPARGRKAAGPRGPAGELRP